MRGFIFFSFLFFAGTIIHAQNEYNFYGKGARAAGMGYAFYAVSDDATAISWNPGGMVQIKRPELAVVNSLTTTKYNHLLYGDNQYKSQYNIDYAGFIYPLKIKQRDLVFGVSFQNKMNYKSAYSTDKDTTLGYSDYANRVTVNTISVSGAYSITPFLGVGLTYNQWFSMGNKADDYSFYNTRTWDKDRYPYDQNVIESTESFRYYGSNLTAGIMLDFSSFRLPLRFAMRYESKFALKDDYEADYRISYRYNNNIDTIYAEKYQGIEKFFFPGIFSFGLSYRIGDYFTIACDLDIRPFKDEVYTWEYDYYKTITTTHTDTLEYSENTDAYYLLKSNANLNQFRIGLEYIFHPKFAFIPVRAGWKNNPTSISDQSTKEQVFAHSLNFGAGLIVKRVSVDFAYERYTYSRNVSIIGEYHTEEKIFNYFILSLIIKI